MKKAAKKAAQKVTRRPATKAVVAKILEEWQPATTEPLELGESAKDFRKDGGKRNRLLAILRDPVFREAEEILKDELGPRSDLPIFFKTKVAAARYHQFAGLKYFIDGLKRLSKEEKPVKPLIGKQLTRELPKSDT